MVAGVWGEACRATDDVCGQRDMLLGVVVVVVVVSGESVGKLMGLEHSSHGCRATRWEGGVGG